jgi:hypothetical protein
VLQSHSVKDNGRKSILAGFQLADADEIVKTCEACQFHAKNIHQRAQTLQTLPISWSLAVWGLDIVGKMPRAVGGYRYVVVTVDKFTKWVEVEPV